MTAPHAEQLIDGYLAQLRAAAADLPKAARDELLTDVQAHIAEARGRERDETDATILNILDRLGEPTAVLAEAGDRLRVEPETPYRPGLLEIAAIVLLPFIWPVGVILLWISPAWKTRDKLIGSLLPPGGYPGLVLLSTAHVLAVHGNGGYSFWQVIQIAVLSLVFFTLPVVTAVYLAVRLRWGRRLKAVTA